MNSSSDSAPDADSSPPPSSPLLPQPPPRTPAQTPPLGGLDPGKLLAAALRSSPVTLPAYDWEPPAPALVNGWFAEYEVDRLIGRGAMGAVYHAVQTRLGRAVAIKLLPAVLAQREEMAARFEREARALARLNHPNIVGLHDFGRTASGYPFIVMEHVAGADLSRLIRSGDLSMPQALEIIGQVCDALQYAHGQGFVHRDIKPGNILVDTTGRVRIADFGLTKILGAEPGQSAGRTLTGASLGTPEYTAPEQLRGGVVDHRADIYSLGVMLYEMLTGDLPRGAWAPPSQRAGADARLDEVVTRAMQTEPDKRYQQAGEVKTAIHAPASAVSTTIAANNTSAAAASAASAAALSGKGGRFHGNAGLAVIFFACAVVLAAMIPEGSAAFAIQVCGPLVLVGLWFLSRPRRPAAWHGLAAGLTVGLTAAGALWLSRAAAEGRFGVQPPKPDGAARKTLLMEQRLNESKAKTSRMLSAIRETTDAQAEKVSELRTRLMGMIRSHGIVDPLLEGRADSGEHPPDGVSKENADHSAGGGSREELQRRLDGLVASRERLLNPTPESPFPVTPDDGVMFDLATQYQKDRRELERMRQSGFGPNHPRIRGLFYSIDRQREILDRASKERKAALEISIRNVLAALNNQQVSDGQDPNAKVSPERMREYSALKIRYELALETLRDLSRSATQLTMGALNLFQQEVDSISGHRPAAGQAQAAVSAGDRGRADQTDLSDRADPVRTSADDSPLPGESAEPVPPKAETLPESVPAEGGRTMPLPAAPTETIPPRPETVSPPAPVEPAPAPAPAPSPAPSSELPKPIQPLPAPPDAAVTPQTPSDSPTPPASEPAR